MESNVHTSGGIGLGGILFVIFLIMKLTEHLSFWNGHFPRFLQSTDAWWDGWFMVFLPLWIPFAIVIAIIISILFLLKR